MVTKYNTGDKVYMPVIIESAVNKGDRVFYHVRAGGDRLERVVPEDEIKAENPATARDGVRVPVMIDDEALDTIVVRPGKQKEEKESAYVRIVPDMTELDEAMRKAEALAESLNQAMEIADSIADKDLSVRLSAILNDKTTELARITTEG